MNKELEQKFVKRWPDWFDVNGSVQHTLMPFGFECGDGWFQLIWDLCEDIEKILNEVFHEMGLSDDDIKVRQVTRKLDKEQIKDFEVIQVKEKFAGLRFYYEDAVEGEGKIIKRVQKAEELSLVTCEECGKEGKVTGKNWLKTLCENCEKERNRT